MSTTDRHDNLHLTSMSNFYAKCWQTFNNNNGNSIAFLPPLWTPSVGIKAYLMPAPSFFGKTTAISTNTNCCHISDAKQSSRRTLTNHFVPASPVQHFLAPHKKSAEIPLDVDCVFVFLCVFPRLCVCLCVRATIVWECFATSVAPPPLLNPLNAPSRGASAWKSRRYCYRRLSSHKYAQEHTNMTSKR